MCEFKSINKLKDTDPQLYKALKILVNRLTTGALIQEVSKTVDLKMKAKDLSNFVFSGQKVKIVHNGETVFSGYANELPYCYFKDCEVKMISTTPAGDAILCIMIAGITKPEEF